MERFVFVPWSSGCVISMPAHSGKFRKGDRLGFVKDNRLKPNSDVPEYLCLEDYNSSGYEDFVLAVPLSDIKFV